MQLYRIAISWDRAQRFEIDRLQACVRLLTLIDRAHWFGIYRLQACVRDIDCWPDRTHWFGIDRLQACVCVLTLIADQIVTIGLALIDYKFVSVCWH